MNAAKQKAAHLKALAQRIASATTTQRSCTDARSSAQWDGIIIGLKAAYYIVDKDVE